MRSKQARATSRAIQSPPGRTARHPSSANHLISFAYVGRVNFSTTIRFTVAFAYLSGSMLKCKTVRCLGVAWGGLATWCSPRIDSRMRARLYANKTEPPYGNTIKRKERFHAERTYAHGDRQKHHEEPSHYRPHDREIPARPRTGTQIHAVPARTFLRGAVPLLQLQPLPLPRDNRATVLQESSSRNDDAQRYGLRL